MKTKFTQGPWSAHQTAIRSTPTKTRPGVRLAVTLCRRDLRDEETCEPSLDEAVANAHLMAAAPKLFEAIEFMLKQLSLCDDETGLGKQRLKEVIRELKKDLST